MAPTCRWRSRPQHQKRTLKCSAASIATYKTDATWRKSIHLPPVCKSEHSSSLLRKTEVFPGQWELIWSLFNVEPHALRERKLDPEIDRVGSPTHIGLPHVGACLATAAGLLLAAKGAADLGSRRPNVHIGDAAVRARRRNKSLCLAHIERKDGRGEARADSVVRPNGLTKFGITHHVEDRRKGFA